MTPAEIREARRALGLTQADLAAALGIAARETVLGWETGKKPITGPAARLLTYMTQGCLDDRMKAILPEHAFADGGPVELVYRNWRPRFVAAVTDAPMTDDAMQGPTGEWLNVILWIDDPTAPPGWDADDLLRRAVTALEVYTQDAFED